MRFQMFIFTTILLLTLILTACPGNETPTNSSTANRNAAENKAAANNPFNTEPVKREETTNSAPTLSPVVKAFCDAMAKKDDAAVRRFYTPAALKSFEAKMKEENVKTLVEYLEVEQIADCEVRNERIEGNTATAEVRTKGSPHGARWKFVREADGWKLTGESADFEAVEKSASSTNAAK